jgi:hypothetical protein
MWLWFAWKRFSFPEPVVVKRFCAARRFFILGIARLALWLRGGGPHRPPVRLGPAGRLLRRQHHRHVAALELRVGLDLPDVGHRGGDPVEDGLAQLEVRELTPDALEGFDLALFSAGGSTSRAPSW